MMKYLDLATTYKFQPVALETSEVTGLNTRPVLKELRIRFKTAY